MVLPVTYWVLLMEFGLIHARGTVSVIYRQVVVSFDMWACGRAGGWACGRASHNPSVIFTFIFDNTCPDAWKCYRFLNVVLLLASSMVSVVHFGHVSCTPH